MGNDSSSQWTGIGLSLTACVLNACGMNLQKIGQVQNKARVICGGLSLSAVAGVVDMISFSFAPQSVLAPLAAVTLVVNLFLAPLMSKGEKLTKIDFVATAVICIGVVGSISTSSTSGENAKTFATARDLVDFTTRTTGLRFIGTYIFTLTFLLITLKRVEARRIRKKDESGPLGLTGALYPLLSAMMVMITVTGAKLSGEVAKISNSETATVRTVLASVGIGLTVCGAICNAIFMNRGFARGNSSLFATPILSGAAVVLNTLAGAIFWDEASALRTRQIMYLALSVHVVVAGVGILLTKSTRVDEDKTKKKRL